MTHERTFYCFQKAENLPHMASSNIKLFMEGLDDDINFGSDIL